MQAHNHEGGEVIIENDGVNGRDDATDKWHNLMLLWLSYIDATFDSDFLAISSNIIIFIHRRGVVMLKRWETVLFLFLFYSSISLTRH